MLICGLLDAKWKHENATTEKVMVALERVRDAPKRYLIARNLIKPPPPPHDGWFDREVAQGSGSDARRITFKWTRTGN